MSFPMLVAKDGFLIDTRLYLFIKTGIRETQHQTVCPRLIHNTYLSDNSLVMIGIIEAFYPTDIRLVYRREADAAIVTQLKLTYPIMDMIIIIRIILESIEFIRQSVLQRLSPVDITLVCMKRAIRIGRIEKPGPTMLVCHHIHDSSQCIRSEFYRNHSFIYFNAIGKVHRNIVQAESSTGSFLRYSIDENLDVLPAEPIQH